MNAEMIKNTLVHDDMPEGDKSAEYKEIMEKLIESLKEVQKKQKGKKKDDSTQDILNASRA